MSGVRVHKDEIDILYAASEKLARASTPDDVLEAISDYPRERGARSGVLQFIDNDSSGEPEWQEHIAEWAQPPHFLVGLGWRRRVIDRLRWLPYPDRPLLVEDTTSDPRLPPETRERLLNNGYQAIVLLPLTINGRYVGLTGFNWHEPHTFDERDQRIYTALQRQVAAVIDAIRLFDQTQRRAVELETAKSEIDLLYSASSKMTSASTPDELLDAVSDYPRSTGATAGILIYFHSSTGHLDNDPAYGEHTAEWKLPGVETPPLGTRFKVRPNSSISYILSQPDAPVMVEDVHAHPHVDQYMLKSAVTYDVSSLAILPLHNRGRWVGMIMFTWTQPHRFTEVDHRVFRALIQQAAPIIDSIRLFDQTQRRATELEEANRETAILYTASNKLTRATTPEDVLDAVSDYPRIRGAVSGRLVYLYMDASGLPRGGEYVATWSVGSYPTPSAGTRATAEEARGMSPLFQNPDSAMLVNDLQRYELLTPAHRKAGADLGVTNLAILPLKNGGRWVGFIQFVWTKQQYFTEVDQRIYAAFTQQAAPIIDSIRLFAETTRRATEVEIAKREIDMLYHASSKMTAAATPDELLDALSEYARSKGAVSGRLVYLYNADSGQPTEGEVMAEWAVGDYPTLPVRGRFNASIQTDLRPLIADPTQPMLVEDLMLYSHLESQQKTIVMNLGLRSMVALPLNNQGRLVGFIRFMWLARQQFTDVDRRIYMALIQQAAPIIDSMRLFEQTERRAHELEIAKQEIDLLYASSNQMVRATNPRDLLEVASHYARQQGVDICLLFYVLTDPAGYLELVDAMDGRGLPRIPKQRFYALPDQNWILNEWKSNENQAFLFGNVAKDERLSEDVRAEFLHFGTQATAVLPLHNRGQWVGMLMFNWHAPRSFDERDQRIYNAIIQQAAPVIDSMRLFEQNVERAARAEHLLKINTALSRAVNEVQILEAIGQYAELHDAFRITLNYLDLVEGGKLTTSRTMAVWEYGRADEYDPAIHLIVPMAQFGYYKLWFDHPERVIFVEDLETDPRFDDDTRARMLAALEYRAWVTLPLHSGGRYQGIITLSWPYARVFSEEERSIYTALMRTLPAVVASRRAYVLEEEARRESEALYRAGQAMNAAVTYADIIQAVELLDWGDLEVSLSMWENFDLDGATYVEVVGVSARSTIPSGLRVPIEMLPQAQEPNPPMVLIITDTRDRTQVDEVTAATMERVGGVRAYAVISLELGRRRMGQLVFQSQQARSFTPREKRLMSGMGDLALAAVERIRLRAVTEQGRQQAESLARLTSDLSQATDEAGILYAIAAYVQPFDAAGMGLSYEEMDDEGVPMSRPVALMKQGIMYTYSPSDPLPRRMSDYGMGGLWRKNVEEVVYMENFYTDSRIPEDQRALLLDQVQTRAVVLIPLFSGGRCHGVVSIFWSEPRTFSTEERYVYQTLMKTVPPVVASRRAYLLEEEARRENEFLYRASRAVNAAVNYDEIARAVHLLELHALEATLSLWENHDYSRAGYMEFVAHTQGTPWPVGSRVPVDEVPLAKKLLKGHMVVVEDTANRKQLDAKTARLLEQTDCHSFITVPLFLGKRYVGNLTFISQTPRNYSQHELRIITAFGDLVIAAVERIRLQAETEKAMQQAELVAQINGALSQAKEEMDILSASAMLADHHGAALSILAYTQANEQLDIVALRSADGSSPIPISLLPITTFSTDDYPILHLAYQYPDESIFIEDTLTDPRTSSEVTQAFIEMVNWGAAVIVPLKSADQWQGILAFAWSSAHEFDADVRALFNAIRPTAASVVTSRRAYLAEALARRETEQRARELALLEERTRIARELHDSVSQALYGIGLGARTAKTLMKRDAGRVGEPLDYILSLAEAGLTEMRALIFELRPESLEQEGLITALTKQAASLQARHGIQVRTRFGDEPVLAVEVKESIYRIAREALHNTVKHAQATQVDLILTGEGEGYRLEIADNGKGFDPSGSFPGHLGLKSMKERTSRLRGAIDMTSAPGVGTRITVHIPAEVEGA